MNALIKSLLTKDNPFNPTEEVLAWIGRRNRKVQVDVAQISFKELKGWRVVDGTGNLCHESWNFFSIVGIDVYIQESRWSL